jgi:dihydroorotase/N-acyl-D-amino-acid deacylase
VDLVIKNGLVVDGTGAPGVEADVRVSDDRIVLVQPDIAGNGVDRVIDASGLVVAPGFIDLMGQSEYHLLIDPRGMSKIMQGVTTEVTCEGSSVAPLNDRSSTKPREYLASFGLELDWTTLPEYFARLRNQGIGPNLATFVGAGQLRSYVVGLEDRTATAAELVEMQRLAGEAMEHGAFGLSSALQYTPDSFANTDELIALARAVAAHGGIYATHQRSEGGRLDSSLDEVFAIARAANLPVEIFHLKTAHPKNWGRMPAVLRRIEDARAEGLDITADVYPYTAASTGLATVLPPWARTGGKTAMLARLADQTTRQKMREEINEPNSDWENIYLGSGGADGIQISAVLNPELRRYVGQRLSTIAAEKGRDVLEVLFDLLLKDNGSTDAIYFVMDETDVRVALAASFTSVCTDSSARAVDGPLAEAIGHPRGWGSFPKILGQYVREEKLLTLETAVRKMTGLPAQRIGLTDRGLVRKGYFADLVIFDPATVADQSTYEESRRYPIGIRYVIVNGEVVVENGKHTGRLAGRPLSSISSRIHV